MYKFVTLILLFLCILSLCTNKHSYTNEVTTMTQTSDDITQTSDDKRDECSPYPKQWSLLPPQNNNYGTQNPMSVYSNPPRREYTYNVTKTKLTEGAPPFNEDNCYQYICPPGFGKNDVCYKCGDLKVSDKLKIVCNK